MALRRAYDKILPIHEAVEAYLRRALPEGDPVLDRIKRTAESSGIPSITPEAGRTLMVMATLLNARRAVELGTGTGYSGIWIARGLAAKGTLTTVEGDSKRAEVARRHFAEAGVASKVRVHVGFCLDYVRGVRAGSLDLVFADATKSEYPDYLEAAHRALRRGGILAADNVFWQGQVLPRDPHNLETHPRDDADLAGILEFTRRLADPRWASLILPFGDGLSLSVKK